MKDNNCRDKVFPKDTACLVKLLINILEANQRRGEKWVRMTFQSLEL